MSADRSHGNGEAFKNLCGDGVLDILAHAGLILLEYLSLYNESVGHGFKLNRWSMFRRSLFSYK